MMNHVFLVGNLAQDPELRYTSSQIPVMTMRLVTNESYYNKETKERKEKVEYHTVVLWGKYGEALNKILGKGSLIGVIGQLTTRNWEDKEGRKRYSTEIKASDIKPLARWGRDRAVGPDANAKAPSQHDKAKANAYVPEDEPVTPDQGDMFDDDDIPF